MRARLGDYIQEYSVKNKKDDNIPVYSVTNTQGFCEGYFGKEVASKDKTTYKIVPRGYFAYNPSRINVGSVDWQREKERVIVSPLYNVFSVSSEIDQQYLFYYLKSDMVLQRIKAVATGSVRNNLKFTTLSDFPIELRSIYEQKEIVKILDKTKRIIELYRMQLESIDELVRARFSEVFGNRDEIKYEMVALKEICTTITGGTPSTRISEYYNGNIPWISTVSLGPNHIDGTTAKAYITQKAIENSSTKLIPPNNILFGTRVGVGKSSINDVEMCTNQDIVAIMGVDERLFNKLYIKHVLDSYQPYFDSIKKGATILGITADDLKKVLIPRAPLELQNQFADFVHEVDKSRLHVLYIS